MRKTAAVCAVALGVVTFAAHASPRAEDGSVGIATATLAAGGSAAPLVGVDRDGVALAVWSTAGGDSIEYAARAPGERLGPVRAVRGAGLPRDVVLDVAPSGAAVIAWIDDEDGGRAEAAVRPGTGRPFGPAQPLGAVPEGGSLADLGVSVSGAGRVAAVWVEHDGDRTHLRRALSDSDGAFPGPNR